MRLQIKTAGKTAKELFMATEYNIRRKKVTVDSVDGEVFVNGMFSGLKKSLTSTM
ncbi:hypothetical protein AGMMS50293_09060 [Spirochaetia bacterium]|nr:hypothetical protein AGMMS50293_09060 [Spirochaetia bacterium]